MPQKQLVIPTFKNDREEAAWWEKNRATVEAGLRAAIREKKTVSIKEVLSQARLKKQLLPVTIRLAQDDLTTARQLASEQGIGYQTYIKLLLHKALKEETTRTGRGR